MSKPPRYSVEELRAALIEENAAHEPQFYLLVTESQAAAIASGYVPTVVVAMARMLIDQETQDARRAARPYPTQGVTTR